MIRLFGFRRAFSSSCSPLTGTSGGVPGGSTRLKGKLRKAIEEDPEDDLQKVMAEKELRKKKVEHAKAVTAKQQELFEHLDQYLSNIQNLITKKPKFFPRHNAVYRYFGTSKEQVKNPYIVSDEVRKLLKKDKVAKAVFLVRLAGSSGSVGMNMILRYLTKQNKNKLALKLHNLMKKWGAKDTDATHLQLLPAIINRPLHNHKKVDRILSSFQKIRDKTHKSDKNALLANANATLHSLRVAGADFNTIREFYDQDMRIRDLTSYTTMLNALARFEETDEIGRLKNSVWSEANGRASNKTLAIDSKILIAYVNSKRTSPSIDEVKEAIELFEENFEVPGKNNVNEVFPIKAPELDVWLRLLTRASMHHACINRFEEAKENGMTLDMAHYDSYIKSISALGDVERARALYQELRAIVSSSENNPSSTMFAQLMSVFLNCESKNIDTELVENIKKLCQKAWGKRPHIHLINSYVKVYKHIFSPAVSPSHEIHPRDGIKALNDFSLSYQVFAHNITQTTNIPECKEALQNTADLCDYIYNHKAWKKHKFIWISKMKGMCLELLANLNKDEVDPKAVENFVYDMDTIVLRQSSRMGRAAKKSKKENQTIMPAF
ncbi:hypothetical protein TRICI_004008 [Trichomonascus ciferrii]|uniref:Mitochondrial 15S rRNA processing factor CCM1 n=1 Tax=Trichomonascus ciferrii TaxID=44093 RepID=A0A642V272_9ASCO|nr:hypothetical protein TRICI_004008 [Trichomonascus ciferrii]